MALAAPISTLDSIREKIEANERLDGEDGLALLRSGELLALGEVADHARRTRGGDDEVSFVQSLALGPAPAEALVEEAVAQRELSGFTELRLVGGEGAVDVVGRLHEALPDVHLVLAGAAGALLPALRSAGLGSLASDASPAAIEEHRAAHRLGIPTHATIPYGGETAEERVACLLRVRALQDETGGLLGLRPHSAAPAAGSDDVMMIALARLLVDNVPSVTASWAAMGMPLAAVALHFGADDVEGTVVREQLPHPAGAPVETERRLGELVRLVREAGRIPVQRDTLHDELRRFDDQ